MELFGNKWFLYYFAQKGIIPGGMNMAQISVNHLTSHYDGSFDNNKYYYNGFPEIMIFY